MELKDLKYFVEIADQKSMRKAAASLYVSQPNLTRSMKNLENEVGAELLKRTNHGVELTSIGEGLYYYANSILKQVDEISKMRLENQKYVEAKISIAIGGCILRDDMMLQYYETIRANRTGIYIVETSVEEVLKSVETLNADIGLVSINHIQMAAFHKICELKGLEFHEIGTGPLYVHVGKKNPLYGREWIDAEELLPYSHVQAPQDYFSNMNYTTNLDGKIHMMDFKKSIIMNNYHAIISMVKRTDAFIFGNKWQKDELEKGQICSIRLNNCDISHYLLWVKRKRETLSDKAEQFLRLILDCYSDPVQR